MKKNSSSSDFFICFTMRNPSSSSKTLASPGRNPSLSASLSRRLSLKSSTAGVQSPMFPSSRRKSGSLETAEPSSPKVTCIGQVKIKSSKKSNKNKNLVNRSRSGREINSFRRREAKAVSICDALSCFMPPSCGGWNSCYGDSNSSSKKEHKRCSVEKRGKSYSCGAVFVRWLMAVEEDEEEKEVRNLNDFNEVGLFIRERETEIDFESAFKRREDEFVVFKEDEVESEEDEEARVSVCIPPKNALLLMRCRSDPVRMAALSTRFWDSPAMKVDCKEEEEIKEEKNIKLSDARVEDDKPDEAEVEKGVVVDENVNHEEEKGVVAEEIVVEKDVKVEDDLVVEEIKDIEEAEEKELKAEVIRCAEKEKVESEEVEIVLRRSISCSTPKSNELLMLKDGGRRRSVSYREKEKRRHSFSVEKEARRHSFCSKKEARRSSFSADNEGSRKGWSFSIEKEILSAKEKPLVLQIVDERKVEEDPPIQEEPTKAVDQPYFELSKKEETRVAVKEKKPHELPECLLLMMYEPKLSMEVSKETWVCSTDFVHWRPNQQPKPKPESRVEEESQKVEDTLAENKNTIAAVQQTPSNPESTISPIEQKLLKNLAVSVLPQAHHFVLTRCKSEPGKSSARLVPDTCFWKARHQPISTAGLGF